MFPPTPPRCPALPPSEEDSGQKEMPSQDALGDSDPENLDNDVFKYNIN